MTRKLKINGEANGEKPNAWLGVALGLMVALVLPVAAASVGWLFGLTVSPLLFLICVVLALVTVWLLTRSLKISIYCLLYIAVSIFLCGLLFDPSYDSNSYHKVSAILLAEGWNPLLTAEYPDVNLWVLHYAKFMETAAATVYAFTGLLEQGKGVNLLLLGAVVAIAADFFRSRGFSARKTTALIFVGAANPVLSTQIFTFYIDYVSYLCTCASILLVCDLLDRRNPRLSTLLLLLFTIVAAGTKFNAFFYQGLLMVFALVWCLCRKARTASVSLCIAGFGALLISALIFAHPYFTNLEGWGNPLYPLLGEGSRDIMGDNTPGLYTAHNRVLNFFINLFWVEKRTFPFTTYDAHVAGFSIVGGVLILFSAAVSIWNRKSFPRSAFYIMGLSLLCCFIFEQSWWARYIPHLWLIPTVTFYCLLKYAPGSKWPKVAILTLAGVAFLLSGVAQLGVNARKTVLLKQTERQLREFDGKLEIAEPSQADLHMLREWGVKFEMVDSIDPSEESDLFYFSGHSRVRMVPAERP